MFREIQLRETITGKLFLHSMPGRYERWEDFRAYLIETGINRIVCLAEAEEIDRKSPSYSCAIRSGAIPCLKLDFPIADFGVPKNREVFAEFVQLVANYLQSGENILVHCAGGIGRTGTFATCLLHCLGYNQLTARQIVAKAGSAAETLQQEDLVDWHFASVCG
jgi:protein-tyrosine phosphatase